jgi:Na+/H+ antiporter NhaD/arsenite permease-like protein
MRHAERTFTLVMLAIIMACLTIALTLHTPDNIPEHGFAMVGAALFLMVAAIMFPIIRYRRPSR